VEGSALKAPTLARRGLVIPIRELSQANHPSRKPVCSQVRLISVDDQRLPERGCPKENRGWVRPTAGL
jgi:hypothetical protein